MKPTKIYVKEILKLAEKNLICSCANITGGGITDNLKRVIPNGLSAKINLSTIKINKIFKWIKKQGVSDEEMLRTFNCGVGFCIIIKQNNLKKVKNLFPKNNQPYLIGKIIRGNKKVHLNEKLLW